MDEFQIKVLENQQSMAVDIAEIKVSLEYHIKRTDLLEDAVALAKQQLELDLSPIKSHINTINIVLKLLGGLSLLLGIAAGIFKVIEFLGPKFL